MPTYSYEHKDLVYKVANELCSKGKEFDLVQSITENSLTQCPECGASVKRIITSAPGFKMAGGTPKFHG